MYIKNSYRSSILLRTFFLYTGMVFLFLAQPFHVKAEEKTLAFDWDEARIYFLLTDRFNDGDPTNNDPHGIGYDTSHPESYHGGDFQGIIDRLDYLEELGINTIWITPIVDNIEWNVRHGKQGEQYGYHGYWAKDFTEVDEHLGDLDTFKELIDQAHDRGIKIMVDVVLNHTGYGLKEWEPGEGIPHFPIPEEQAVFIGMLRENPVTNDEIKGELSGLPDFVTEDSEVRRQIIQWQVDWLERARTDRGDTIDYFRVDTVKHVESETWREFKSELLKMEPDFKLMGEHFGGSINDTGGYLGPDQMDSLLDFDFKNLADHFTRGKIEAVENLLKTRNEMLSETATMGQFLSSHDEDGFLYARVKGDEGLHKVAAALQITAKGQPVIYYGEEIALSGPTAGDMDRGEFNQNRYDFDWSLVEESEMHEHYKKLLNIRKDHSKVFAKGDRNHIAGTNQDGYSIFTRTFEDETVIVGLNIKEERADATFSVDLEPRTELIDLYNEETYSVSNEQTVTIELPENAAGGTAILIVGEVQTAASSGTNQTALYVVGLLVIIGGSIWYFRKKAKP